MYNLDDVKRKLDKVKLDLNKDNSINFFKLVNEFGINQLKHQVIDYMKTIKPKEDWVPEAICSVIMSLQRDKGFLEDEKHKTTRHE